MQIEIDNTSYKGTNGAPGKGGKTGSFSHYYIGDFEPVKGRHG